MFFSILLILSLLYYVYYKVCFKYWPKKGLPISNPTFPFGDLSTSILGTESVYVRLHHLYTEFKSQGYKHAGIYFFNGPLYFPINPKIIKNILVSDFDHFTDRGMYENPQKLPLSSHIFSMKNQQWKPLRNKLSPAFTSAKLRSLHQIILTNCNSLAEYLKPGPMDIREVLMRFSADLIGSSSFGINTNSLQSPGNKFSQMVNKISNHSSWKLLRVALEEGLQNPGNIEKIAYSDKSVEDFFTEIVSQTVKYRDENGVKRNDFLNVLMELRSSSGITIKEIVAEAFLFFIAGFKTSAFTMCYCVHELAQNLDLQEKIREEIMGIKNSEFSYEDIMRLPKLERALKETMRKYPPLPMLNRICTKNYKIPGTEITIEEGTPVIISVLGLHRDPDFYPEPLIFNPDRFLKKTEPYTFLPFGEGPRNCIGLRFGMMTLKLTIASLLKKFKFLPNPKTPRDLVLDPSTTSILFNVLNGIHVTLEECT